MDQIKNSDYYLDKITMENELKSINLKMKKDGDKITSGFLPIKLENNNYVLCLKYKKNNEIVSFIHFVIKKNYLDLSKYIFVIYSYTFKNYRGLGFNTKLRVILEETAQFNKIPGIISIPFNESESRYVLNKLGYKNVKSDIFIKYIK